MDKIECTSHFDVKAYLIYSDEFVVTICKCFAINDQVYEENKYIGREIGCSCNKDCETEYENIERNLMPLSYITEKETEQRAEPILFSSVGFYALDVSPALNRLLDEVENTKKLVLVLFSENCVFFAFFTFNMQSMGRNIMAMQSKNGVKSLQFSFELQ